MSHRAYTYGNDGWICLRTTHQRSTINNQFVNYFSIPNHTDQVSFVTSFFHIFVLLRDFLFVRRLLDSNQRHGHFQACSTDWAKSTNLCHTNSTVVRTVIELVCTCDILNMALYSLLNIIFLFISENIICWYNWQ